ncbi:MAG: 6,7-dimethyl-8-ribityllumazine synthase [Pseudomonadota bacterium]
MTEKPHILIVDASFYADIVDELRAGATEALEQAGATFERVSVPGALEAPAAVAIAADTGRFDGFVVLGCVIRGETSHYDYVCSESAHGLQILAVERRLAIGNGILTTENQAQAMVRAKRSEKNKGRDAVEACLAVLALKQRFAVEV